MSDSSDDDKGAGHATLNSNSVKPTPPQWEFRPEIFGLSISHALPPNTTDATRKPVGVHGVPLAVSTTSQENEPRCETYDHSKDERSTSRGEPEELKSSKNTKAAKGMPSFLSTISAATDAKTSAYKLQGDFDDRRATFHNIVGKFAHDENRERSQSLDATQGEDNIDAMAVTCKRCIRGPKYKSGHDLSCPKSKYYNMPMEVVALFKTGGVRKRKREKSEDLESTPKSLNKHEVICGSDVSKLESFTSNKKYCDDDRNSAIYAQTYSMDKTIPAKTAQQGTLLNDKSSVSTDAFSEEGNIKVPPKSTTSVVTNPHNFSNDPLTGTKRNNSSNIQDNPHSPDPHSPDPHNPDPHNPDAHNPDPYNPDAHNPDPYNPDAHNPDPHSVRDPHSYGVSVHSDISMNCKRCIRGPSYKCGHALSCPKSKYYNIPQEVVSLFKNTGRRRKNLKKEEDKPEKRKKKEVNMGLREAFPPGEPLSKRNIATANNIQRASAEAMCNASIGGHDELHRARLEEIINELASKKELAGTNSGTKRTSKESLRNELAFMKYTAKQNSTGFTEFQKASIEELSTELAITKSLSTNTGVQRNSTETLCKELVLMKKFNNETSGSLDVGQTSKKSGLTEGAIKEASGTYVDNDRALEAIRQESVLMKNVRKEANDGSYSDFQRAMEAMRNNWTLVNSIRNETSGPYGDLQSASKDTTGIQNDVHRSSLEAMGNEVSLTKSDSKNPSDASTSIVQKYGHVESKELNNSSSSTFPMQCISKYSQQKSNDKYDTNASLEDTEIKQVSDKAPPQAEWEGKSNMRNNDNRTLIDAGAFDLSMKKYLSNQEGQPLSQTIGHHNYKIDSSKIQSQGLKVARDVKNVMDLVPPGLPILNMPSSKDEKHDHAEVENFSEQTTCKRCLRGKTYKLGHDITCRKSIYYNIDPDVIATMKKAGGLRNILKKRAEEEKFNETPTQEDITHQSSEAKLTCSLTKEKQHILKESSFFNPDVASPATAVGRKETVLEEISNDKDMNPCMRCQLGRACRAGHDLNCVHSTYYNMPPDLVAKVKSDRQNHSVSYVDTSCKKCLLGTWSKLPHNITCVKSKYYNMPPDLVAQVKAHIKDMKKETAMNNNTPQGSHDATSQIRNDATVQSIINMNVDYNNINLKTSAEDTTPFEVKSMSTTNAYYDNGEAKIDTTSYTSSAYDENNIQTIQNSQSSTVTLGTNKKEIDEDISRITGSGEYSHTGVSKAKISQSNVGKKPWNLGVKIRDDVKDKIRASVKARHRKKFMEKLVDLGMTEDEWVKEKKKVKVTRERERRRRLKEERATSSERQEDFGSSIVEATGLGTSCGINDGESAHTRSEERSDDLENRSPIWRKSL